MLERIEWYLVGSAGLFEIVLLLLLCQPINRSHVENWLKWLIGGAFLYHAGYFGRLIVLHEPHGLGLFIDRVSMSTLCAGVLIMPSAMLHAGIRLYQLGDEPYRPINQQSPYLWFVYLPILMLIPAVFSVLTQIDSNFMDSTAYLHPIYLAWLTFANMTAAFLFITISMKSCHPIRRTFFAWVYLFLVGLTLIVGFYILFAASRSFEPPVRLVITVAPVLPSILFVWFTLKNRLLPLVYEQSIVYGGIVLNLLFLHRLIVTPITIELKQILNIDFILIEVIIVSIVIWSIKSIRMRVSESLRFLLSPHAFQIRNTTRELSLWVAQNPTGSERERLLYFADELKIRYKLNWVTIYLRDPIHHWIATSTEKNDKWHQNCEADLELFSQVTSQNHMAIERGEEIVHGSNWRAITESMEKLECDIVFPMSFRSTNGLVLFGSRVIFDRLASEQVNAIGVLIDQFAATLQTVREHRARQLIERKNLQDEKRSTLGLISGSLAHEIRNPLSSIRTIASLVSEETSPQSSHKRDLELIVSEVDRLSQTLQRVLDFSRPGSCNEESVSVDRVIERVLCIMDYHARQKGVQLSQNLRSKDALIRGSEMACNEIAMNLIKNAIEAVENVSTKQVSISSEVDRDHLVLTVSDSGIGIPLDKHEIIFEPFETYKPSGTGLGLFIVAERVKELKGTIAIESRQGEFESFRCQGTTFVIRIPIVSPKKQIDD